VDMKEDEKDRTLWKLGYRNRPTPACGNNKPGSRQMMTMSKITKFVQQLSRHVICVVMENLYNLIPLDAPDKFVDVP